MIQPEKPQAVIYCRVSCKSQEDEGHGLVSQEHRCKTYAQQKGYEVAATFPDTISGGGDFMKRPGMVALLSFLDAQPGQRFVVIFDDLKRFARDTEFHIRLRREFDARGATIECLNFKLEDTPEGRFIETILAAQGELERKQNGRQVAQKMRARMENGYWVNKAPVGLRYKAMKGQGKVLIPDEPLASIVREGLESYACGRFQTQSELVAFFESHPTFPTNSQGRVVPQSVAGMLSQPLYAGYICSEFYGIDWLKGKHEPLISFDTYEKIQERRQSRVQFPRRKNIGNDFVLRGAVICGACKTPLRSCWSKGRSKSYAYYLCQNKACSTYGKSIPRETLENDVGDLIKTAQPLPGLFTLARAMFNAAWDATEARRKQALQSAREQAKTLDKQTKTLLDRMLKTDNEAALQAYETKLADLTKQKHKLEEQRQNLSRPRGTLEEKLEPALRFLANPHKLWASGSTNVRRLVVKLVFAGHLEYTHNQGARTAPLSLPFKALGGLQNGQNENGGA